MEGFLKDSDLSESEANSTSSSSNKNFATPFASALKTSTPGKSSYDHNQIVFGRLLDRMCHDQKN